jgi:peptidoglycan/LPS O-acetylase OafA/YrhL
MQNTLRMPSTQVVKYPAPSDGSHRPGQIREFEGLRGLLALWIVFVHAVLFSGLILRTQTGLSGLVLGKFFKGQHGVAVFIILSGFVVSMQLQRRQLSFGEFMGSRFFRIYPLYLMSLALAMVTVFLMPGVLETGSWFRNEHFAAMHSVSFQERTYLHWHLLFHVLLIQAAVPNAWFPEAHWAILGPTWSLSHEWQFYLIAPRLRKISNSPLGLIFVAILVVAASRIAARLQLGLDWSLLSTLPLFLVGILTYRFHEQIASRPETTLAQASTPVCGLVAFAIIANWKVIPIVIWAIVYATVIATDRRCRSPFGALFAGLSRFLKNRVFLWLGSISYPLYLLHWPYMIIVLSCALKLRPDLTSAQAFGMFAVSIPPLLWLCHLVHRSVETPLVGFGKRFRKSLGQQADAMPNTAQRSASTHLSS